MSNKKLEVCWRTFEWIQWKKKYLQFLNSKKFQVQKVILQIFTVIWFAVLCGESKMTKMLEIRVSSSKQEEKVGTE